MDTIAIGVDHGWSSTKTTHFIFPSGVGEITTEPALTNNILEFEGKWYQVGTDRQPVMTNKTEDERYYLLTLAAIAKELQLQKRKKAKIYLAAGLPLTRFGAEKSDFLQYLGRNRNIDYKFEGDTYHLELAKVSVYPQCYAAVVNKLDSLPPEVIVVDIGSWTIDIMPIRDYQPMEQSSLTLSKGIINCMNHINGECIRQFNTDLSESSIEEMMRTGTVSLDKKYVNLMQSELHKFVADLWNLLIENGYRIKITPVIFCGGGATLMKNFGPKEANLSYIEDVKANAKGFEYLGKMWLINNPI